MGVRSAVVVLLLAGGVAHAQPAETPACSLCEPATFAVRAGFESVRYRPQFDEHDPQGSTPSLEIEGGQWITPDTALTLVASYRSYDDPSQLDTQYGAPVHIRHAMFGMRVAHHGRVSGLFGGLGTGGTWTRASGSGLREDDSGHYAELFVGGDVAHSGSLAFELEGRIALGSANVLGASLGLAWDPPHRPRCPEPSHDHVVGALRIGEAYSDYEQQDSQPQDWGRWIEGEAGWRFGDHFALVAFVSYTKFSGYLNDFYGNQTLYTFHHTRYGVRTQLWPVRRVFVAPGIGTVSGDGGSHTMVDLEIGIELYRRGHLAFDATSQGSMSGWDYGIFETSYALGVAYR